MTILSDLIFAYLRDSASRDMVVDGSGTTVMFKYTAPAQMEVQRINFTFLDAGMRNEYFGGIVALTNGLLVKGYDVDGSVLIDFLDGETIKVNAGFAALAGVDSVVTATVGADALPIRWTLSKATGDAIELMKGQYIGITVQDALAGIDRLDALLQGKLI